MDRFGFKQQTKLHDNNTRRSLSIYRKFFWARPHESHNNTENHRNTKRHKHNKRLQQLIALCLIGTTTPTFASDVGGVSATANPVANSSGSVTNQSYTSFTGAVYNEHIWKWNTVSRPDHERYSLPHWKYCHKRPYEDYYMDPVFNNVDANDDSVPDNPGEILYYIPTRTGQKDSTTVSLGISATWSKPLDKKLQEQCKQAAQANINYMVQNTANKRLDFEIARLKNCGELMKAGIMFHPQSPYYAVCADVVLVNPPGTLPNHSHSITQIHYQLVMQMI